MRGWPHRDSGARTTRLRLRSSLPRCAGPTPGRLLFLNPALEAEGSGWVRGAADAAGSAAPGGVYEEVIMNLQAEITQAIIEQLETGVKPWTCPWVRERGAGAWPYNHATSRRYQGLNVLLLWLAADQQQFSSAGWLTLCQANRLGGRVRKGATSTVAVFYKPYDKILNPGDPGYPAEGDGRPVTDTVRVLRPFRVFNLDQVDGLEPETAAVVPLAEFSPIERAETLLAASGAVIRERGDRAMYLGGERDAIDLPERRRFRSAEDFYATALHELVHWSGHPGRLDRHDPNDDVQAAYAFEELVAELGSAYLCATLGVTGTLSEHADYIGLWLERLRRDRRAIFRAAALAGQAHDYLMAFIAAGDDNESRGMRRQAE